MLRAVPFLLTLCLSGYLLFTPAGTEPPPFPYADKVVHFSLFVLLALTGLVTRLRWSTLAAALLLYAVASEILQGVLPIGRTTSALDALADLTGTALVLVPAWLRSRG